jgi:hypothetical protein
MGQIHLPGSYWFSKTAQLVPYRNDTELLALIALDFDLEARAVAARPFRLIYDARCGRRRSHRWPPHAEPHVPDFFVLLDEDPDIPLFPHGRVLDVGAHVPGTREMKPLPLPMSHLDAVQHAYEDVGWEYAYMLVPGEPRASNLRLLAGFRREPDFPWFDEIAQRFFEVGSFAPKPFDAVAAAAGPLRLSKPVLLHMIWMHVFSFNFDQPLSGRTPVFLCEDLMRRPRRRGELLD